MRTYQIVQMIPVVTLFVIAIALIRSMSASRKIGVPAKENPAPPPAVAWVNTDGEFHQTTVAWKRSSVPQAATTPAPRLSPRLAAAAPNALELAAAAAPTGARLVDLSGRYHAGSFPIPATGVTIGRSAQFADILLGDTHVSSRHAWIGFRSGKPVLRDLNSTNGTFLNGQIDAPVSEVALSSGDTILLGRHQGEQFLFVME